METYNSGVRGERDSFSQHYSWANLKFILYKKPVIKNIFYLIKSLLISIYLFLYCMSLRPKPMVCRKSNSKTEVCIKTSLPSENKKKNYTLDKPSARFIKKKRERALINEIRSENYF